jgi:uncharacterized coiled-coil DUF342 family protein
MNRVNAIVLEDFYDLRRRIEECDARIDGFEKGLLEFVAKRDQLREQADELAEFLIAQGVVVAEPTPA